MEGWRNVQKELWECRAQERSGGREGQAKVFQEESFLKMKRLSKMDGAEIAVKGMGIPPNYQRNLEIREGS